MSEIKLHKLLEKKQQSWLADYLRKRRERQTKEWERVWEIYNNHEKKTQHCAEAPQAPARTCYLGKADKTLQNLTDKPSKKMRLLYWVFEILGGIVILIIVGVSLFGLIVYLLMWKM